MFEYLVKIPNYLPSAFIFRKKKNVLYICIIILLIILPVTQIITKITFQVKRLDYL